MINPHHIVILSGWNPGHDDGVLPIAVITTSDTHLEIAEARVQHSRPRIGSANLEGHCLAAALSQVSVRQTHETPSQASAPKKRHGGDLENVQVEVLPNTEEISRKTATGIDHYLAEPSRGGHLCPEEAARPGVGEALALGGFEISHISGSGFPRTKS
jgi:hypothetical protein